MSLARNFAANVEILTGDGYVATKVHRAIIRELGTGNFWQLSYDIHTGRRGRPTHHKGMYLTKESAEKAARRVIVVQAPKVRNVVITNTKADY